MELLRELSGQNVGNRYPIIVSSFNVLSVYLLMNASSVLKMLKQNYSICYQDNRLIIASVMFMTQTPLHTYNNLSTAQCTTMVHCSERILLVL